LDDNIKWFSIMGKEVEVGNKLRQLNNRWAA